MTENKWSNASTLETTIALTALGPRRGRLYANAICALLTKWAPHPAVTAALDTNERFADNEASKYDLIRHRQTVSRLCQALLKGDEADQLDEQDIPKYFVFGAAAEACSSVDAALAATNIVVTALCSVEHITFMPALRRLYPMYTEIAGPANRFPILADRFITPTILALARTMYDARDFAALPILADALEEAGCDDPHVLAHCRDPNLTHVRGCWVVDLVLGQS